MFKTLKRLVLGPPIPSHELIHQRLSKKIALAVFSSDALSSVAYATEEILLVLVLAGTAATQYSIWLALAIGTLLIILISSYHQTVEAYPSGGGAYIVAKENLGTKFGLIAAASLLVDYILTVSVSIASGVAAITSAFPGLFEHRVGLCSFFILIITLANLRGVKESGFLFSIPTYLFIGTMFLLLGVGFYRFFSGIPLPPPPAAAPAAAPIHALTVFLLLRAFSSGCAALTGVEAISNGVPAFEPPEPHNANTTLLWMGVVLFTLFLGITELARLYHILPGAHETVVSQIARTVFGGGFLYYLAQISTALILLLAANTSFADFPRLASLLAKDSYLPRQLTGMGDRLAFSNGIILLGLASGLLVFLFKANTHRLIPLYAVGVFISFTLSQSGMVQHWIKLKGPGWHHKIVVNCLGATATFIALSVIIATKFTHGAWMVLLLIPLIIAFFLAIHRHYGSTTVQLHPEFVDILPPKLHRVIVPISTITKGTMMAISYAASISNDVRAVYVGLDPVRVVKLKEIWKAYCIDIPLVILDSPYRSIIQPLIKYIDELLAEEEDQLITVVLPEFVPAKWWHNILHNQTALLMRGILQFKKKVVITSVRHILEY
jgi:amino acid transporter